MLSPNEIKPGAVAYFEQYLLHQSKEMTHVPEVRGETTKLRPFVCTARTGDSSSWAGLTTVRSQHAAFEVDPQDVANAYGPIADGKCYVHGTVYSGPNRVFITASANERPFPLGRPQMLAGGLAVVAQAVRSRSEYESKRKARGSAPEVLPIVWDAEEQLAIWFPEYASYGRFGSRGVDLVSNPIRATLWTRRNDAERAATNILSEGVLIRDRNGPVPFYRGPFELHIISLRPSLVRRETYDFAGITGDLDAPIDRGV